MPPSANTVLLTILAASTAVKAVLDYRQQNKTAQKTVEVADTLEKTGEATNKALDAIGKTTGEIHTLVNSDWGKLLHQHAIMARSQAESIQRNRRATKTQKKLALQIAEDAERDSRIHDSKQAKVDILNATEAAALNQK